MNIFELVAKIVLDSSEAKQEMADTEKSAETLGDKLKNGLKTAAGVGAAALTAAGAAAFTFGKEMLQGVGQVAEYGDNIDKMSQKMGMSAEAYQEWDAIMRHSGTSIESMNASMKTMSAAAESGSDAFQKLGISQEEVANMSKEDLFSAVITGLQGMEEGTERTYIASQLLGRGATELGALLNTSAEDTEAMRQRVHELGGVMSDAAVKDAAAYQDSLQDLQTSISGLKNNFLSQFMPSIKTVMDGLTEIFAGNGGKGIETVKQGLQMIGQSIQDAMPQIMETMSTIISSLLQLLVEALPGFLDMGFELIGKMINGITNNMPAIISKIIEVATKLITTLIQRLPEFLQMGIKFIVQMISGLVQAAPQILTALGQIGSQMLKSLGEIDWLGLGKNIVDGIARGIANFGSAIWNNLKGAVSGAWEKAKNFLGISSPSRLMRDTVGAMIPKGIAVGIEANTDEVTEAMADLAAIPAQWNASDFGFNAEMPEGVEAMRGITINVYPRENQDEREVADMVMDRMNDVIMRRGLVYAE